MHILPGMKRTCSAAGEIGLERQLEVILDPQADVSLISQITAVEMNLPPIEGAELPKLGWIGAQRQNTYAAYALWVRMTDDSGVQRRVKTTAYGVDKEGVPLLLGNPFLQQGDIHLSCGAQTWRWGYTKAAIQFVTAEDFEKDIEQNSLSPSLLGVIQSTGISWERLARVNRARVAQEPSLPSALHDYRDVFDEDAAATPPNFKESDHAIPLMEGKEPPYGPLYNLSARELEVLREYLEDAMQKGWIRHSTSPAGAPILFVPKKDGTLRLCVDYRGLNSVTIKDRCALPLVGETLDRLCGARYYTTLDLRNAYHRIRIKAGDEWKTAFRTRYGHFEYLVMPFGLTNAPASFQAYINKALAQHLDHICVVYLDDILIYTHSEDLALHWRAVCEVLGSLRRAELFVNLSKCTFASSEVHFLGFIVGTRGVRADPARTETIMGWPRPTNIKELQSFLGFANFYRRFIEGYARETSPLSDLLKKSQEFSWNAEADNAFQRLKERFSSAPILRHFDPATVIRLETDASTFAISGILSQLFEDQKWHPVAFISRKLQAAELNYEVYDLELLAIVYCFKQWRHYLESTQHTIQVLSDHNNLRGMRAVQKLSPRQARWAMYLAAFDFEVEHRPGKMNPADGPSRRADYVQENLSLTHLLPTLQRKLRLRDEHSRARGSTNELSSLGACETHVAHVCRTEKVPTAGAMECTPCVPRSLARVLVGSEPAIVAADLLTEVQQLQQRDALAVKHIADLESEESTRRRSKAQVWRLDERQVLRYKGRVYIPDEPALRQEILFQNHDTHMAGHFGARRTLELIERTYYWPSMSQDVRDYVRTCAVCQRSKAPRHSKYGQLAPLPIPGDIFEEVSLDFITGLPPARDRTGCAFDAILVIVCRFSKMAIYIPAQKSWDAKEFAEAYFKEIILKFGVQNGIVSDRGSVFTSAFWAEICYQLQVKRRLSTAFHPQTDGQTERQNQTLEQYLRIFTTASQDDWVSLLPIAQFAYNNSVHDSTKTTPFYAVYGKHPILTMPPVDSRQEGEVPSAIDRVKRIHAARKSLTEHLKAAQEYQRRYHNKSHKPESFRQGDLVLLSTKHLHLRHQPSKKLSSKFVGPFRVQDAVGTQAYRLILPPNYRIHNVFHISLLERWKSRLGKEDNTQPPEVTSEGEEVWEVEKILAKRKRKGQQQYLLRWKGYDESWDTWTPELDFEDMDEQLRAFEEGKGASPTTKRPRA
jgi:hypothetical protein